MRRTRLTDLAMRGFRSRKPKVKRRLPINNSGFGFTETVYDSAEFSDERVSPNDWEAMWEEEEEYQDLRWEAQLKVKQLIDNIISSESTSNSNVKILVEKAFESLDESERSEVASALGDVSRSVGERSSTCFIVRSKTS